MNILSIKIQITDKQTHYLNKIITKQSILNILGILFFTAQYRRNQNRKARYRRVKISNTIIYFQKQ